MSPSRTSFPTWARSQEASTASTGSTTTETTNPTIAGGPHQRSKPRIERHGEAVRAKIKIAAELYPFRFLAARQKPQKDGGGWAIEVFE